MLKVGSKKSSAPAVPEMPMEDPMAGVDPMAGADPMAGEDPMAGADPMAGEESGAEDDSTMSIINQLSDEDKEAVRSYAESMLNKHGGKDDAAPEGDMEDPMVGAEGGAPEMAPPVPEGRCFTKKQLKEAFGVGRDSEEMQRVKNKKLGKVNRNNPFIARRFE